MLANLKFNSYEAYYHSNEIGTFSKDVCRNLLSHKAPVLQSLHLTICLDECNAMDIGILIGRAVSRNVRELALRVQYNYGEEFRFPRCLYNCETLETLKLEFDVHINVPSTICLKSLRTLQLVFVDFKDDESFLNLLSGCPSLENLEVHGIRYSSVKTFTIAVPSLQRLRIYTCSGDPFPGYVINAPSLKYLEIDICGLGVGFCLIENVKKLVEATFSVSSHEINENLLRSLTSVRRLSLELSPLKIKFPTGSIFYQLVSLELHTNKEAWYNLLSLMLHSSPNLQVLKLIDHMDCRNDFVADMEWIQPNNVPECLLFHLETFMWEGNYYKWEKEVAKYILRNSKHLKRATFFSKDMSSEDRLEIGLR
ncbi:unnamed protein product [Arabidopsis halleri]